MTPNTLKIKWALAERLACIFPTKAARFAVMVVPMFSPKTIAAAISKGIQPLLAMTKVKAMAALEDCTVIVRSVQKKKKNNAERIP